MKSTIILVVILVFGFVGYCGFSNNQRVSDDRILIHIVDLNTQQLKFYWKNEKGEIIGDFDHLKQTLSTRNETLIFATNGGMYNKDHSPQGLYIDNGLVLTPIDTVQKGFGNFYMQPNGIFYITDSNKAEVCKTEDFNFNNVKFATQSGPMLLIDGKIHSQFREGSTNLNIRNGVGVLPNGNLIFGMSKQKINFYDFASFFKNRGCHNALYLDGFVSKTYLPDQNWQTKGGNFGVIIGVSIIKN